MVRRRAHPPQPPLANDQPSSLLHLPEAILHEICTRLDSRSRMALAQTHPNLNTSAVNAFFKQLTLQLDSAGRIPSVCWPQHAPKVQTLVLEGQMAKHDKDLHKLLRQACEPRSARVLSSVTSLHLRDWVLGTLNKPSTTSLLLMSKAFPALTHLKLEHCAEADSLLVRASDYLTRLTSLVVHDNVDGPPTNQWTPPDVPAPIIPSKVHLVTCLTSLSLTTYDSYETFYPVDISPLSQLVGLQRLELALPTLQLTGMAAIAQACSQLTQLKFVHDGEDDYHDWQVDADDVPLTWPHLVEAHVMAPAHLLLLLNLHSAATAPALQRLHVNVVWPSVMDEDDQGAPLALMGLLGQSPALQQPVGVTTAPDLTAALEMLAPLGGKLRQLVMHDAYVSDNDTPGRVLPLLRALPNLTCLTLCGNERSAFALVPLLSAPGCGLTRFIVGLMGAEGERWEPHENETTVWYGRLRELMGMVHRKWPKRRKQKGRQQQRGQPQGQQQQQQQQLAQPQSQQLPRVQGQQQQQRAQRQGQQQHHQQQQQQPQGQQQQQGRQQQQAQPATPAARTSGAGVAPAAAVPSDVEAQVARVAAAASMAGLQSSAPAAASAAAAAAAAAARSSGARAPAATAAVATPARQAEPAAALAASAASRAAAAANVAACAATSPAAAAAVAASAATRPAAAAGANPAGTSSSWAVSGAPAPAPAPAPAITFGTWAVAGAPAPASTSGTRVSPPAAAPASLSSRNHDEKQQQVLAAAANTTATDAHPAPASRAAPAAPAAASAAPPAAPSHPPIHIFFGAWCPAGDIDHHAVEHNPHYLRLRQLAAASHTGAGAAGRRFRLYECEGGSAADMALRLGEGGAWLDRHYERLVELWGLYGPPPESEDEDEDELESEYEDSMYGDEYEDDEDEDDEYGDGQAYWVV